MAIGNLFSSYGANVTNRLVTLTFRLFDLTTALPVRECLYKIKLSKISVCSYDSFGL